MQGVCSTGGTLTSAAGSVSGANTLTAASRSVAAAVPAAAVGI